MAASLRRLDWVLLAAVAAIVGYGLWAIAGITRHDIPGNPNYYVVRQGDLRRGRRRSGSSRCVFVDPDVYRRGKRWIYGEPRRAAAARARSPAPCRATRAAGSTSGRSASSRPSSGSS